MIHLDNCPACRSKSLETRLEYHFTPPTHQQYARCASFAERRLWLLFHEVCPGEGEICFKLQHCTRCDLLFTNPRFNAEEIQRKYRSLVALNSTAGEYARTPIHDPRRRAGRIYELLSRYLPPCRGKRRIADVGGQFGHNLAAFPASDWSCYVIDYETHDVYPDLQYLQPDWRRIDLEFDAIISNHTLEHLSFPSDALAQMLSRLSVGGSIYIEVPAGAFREAYRLQEPLTHFNFFSERSLLNLVHNAGLTLAHLDTRYQWVTDHPMHCINLVARKDGAPETNASRKALDSRQMRNRAGFFLPMLARKLLARWVSFP